MAAILAGILRSFQRRWYSGWHKQVQLFSGWTRSKCAINGSQVDAIKENYVVLVDLLSERYGRKPKVIATYMRALYNTQKPDTNLKSLRNF